jgi:hypothetical protein
LPLFATMENGGEQIVSHPIKLSPEELDKRYATCAVYV